MDTERGSISSSEISRTAHLQDRTVACLPPSYGQLVTILSIDGCGIRGIIPGTILAYLESQLQVYVTDSKLKIVCKSYIHFLLLNLLKKLAV